MSKCAAVTQVGTACKGIPMPGESYCYAHHPDTLEARRKAGSKGGKRGGRGRQSPVSTELARLQTVFEQMAEDIRAGTLDRGSAAVMIQAYNGARSCLAAMLKAKELELLEVRLTELEERYGKTNGTRTGVGYGGLHR
jgi:hypothetical protein